MAVGLCGPPLTHYVSTINNAASYYGEGNNSYNDNFINNLFSY